MISDKTIRECECLKSSKGKVMRVRQVREVERSSFRFVLINYRDIYSGLNKINTEGLKKTLKKEER